MLYWLQLFTHINGKGKHLALSVRVWKPLFRTGPTFLPAFSDTQHKRGVRSLACRFNQQTLPFTCACNSQSGLCILHSDARRTKPDTASLKFEACSRSERDSAGNSACFNLKFRRSRCHWKMPESRFSSKSYLYKNICKHKAEAWWHSYDSLFWASQPSPATLTELEWGSSQPVEYNSLSLWLSCLALHGSFLNPGA